jgi:2,4-dienoyl-CoA reductase-like NADH-dependent reductase (Old Yellow Enzyme family)/thioredoxin reductase
VALTKVFEPINIGPVTIPNRVVRTAHGSNIGGGRVSDDLIAYHEERAKGGVGLTVIEILGVHWASPAPLNVSDPTLKDSYQKLVAATQPHGMKVFQQLWHGGHNAAPPDGSPPWSASDVPSPTVGIPPISMSKGMIDEVVAGFAQAAALCEAGGLDGVEVHCAHGYLIQQFLSTGHNLREDDYGGPLQNRLRFMFEVIRAIRSEVSKDFAVGVRLAPDLVPGGMSVQDTADVVQALDAQCPVDHINISMGSYHAFPKMIGGMHEPAGYEMATSEPVTRLTKTPTIVTGRFRTLEEVDNVLRSGEADLVGMTRATIADPALVNKTKAGRVAEVRPCIACNQGCVGQVLGPPGRMGCAVNVAVGFERTLSEDLLETVVEPRKVLVVGGGPAGMEAARIARLRGHEVVLCEAASDLGGAINLASRTPTRHGFADITHWLEQEIYRLGVEVRLSTYVGVDDVGDIGPDVVIVATGSEPRANGVQLSHPGAPALGMDKPHVITSHELLSGHNIVGTTAAVVDDLGHFEGIGVAEYLQEAGSDVTYVTRYNSLSPRLEPALMVDPALARMQARGNFTLIPRAHVTAVEDASLAVELLAGGEALEIPAETVVFVTHNRSRRELFEALQEYDAEVLVAGDANTPRFVEHAIRDGHRVGRSV